MQEVCVAQLFKATAAFCSSTVHESKPDHGDNAPNLQMHSEIEDLLGKRKGPEGLEDFVRSSKKLKCDSQTLHVSHDCRSLVGRLQLCNKKRHSWGGLSAAGDCLAFTDSTASICCSISRELDASLVGKLVRVNSWSFIPVKDSRGFTKPRSDPCTMIRSTKTSVPRDMALKSSSNFHAAQPQDSEKKYVSRGATEIGTDVWDGHSDVAEGLGFLEIHSLELLQKQNIRLDTFPSLCVDPEAADIRNALFESPLIKREEKRPRLTICGNLHSISPQFSLPCNYSDAHGDTKTSSKLAGSSKDSRQKSNHLSMIGFLVELNYCQSCSFHYIDSWTMGVKKGSRRDRQLFDDGHLSVGEDSRHGTDEDNDNVNLDRRNSFQVYFSGSLASWRPILSGYIKECLTISGLRRKLVLTGTGRRYQFLLVATRTSVILPVLDTHTNLRVHCIPREKVSERERKQGASAIRLQCFAPNFQRMSETDCSKHPRVRSYAGFVTSILFQGALVELDKHVWLVYTQQGKRQLLGLRVGAMVALRDVHAITIHNPSEKALVLGACIRSHVSVLLFSPLHSPSLNLLHSSSLLLRYVQKVSFASAFWIFSVIGSFRQKFRGIYSEKELMGSKKDPGIIWMYVKKLLAPDGTLERPDYFKEFFDHQHISCLGGRVASVSLTKVPPISTFCQDIEASLQSPRSKMWLSRSGGATDFQRWLKKKRLLSSLGISLASWQFAHSIISSQELGVTLLGSLEICQTSGQLQLIDTTGSVYVVVPDLFSSTQISKTYQVSRFTLIVKELTEGSDIIEDGRCEGGRDSSISWSSLLKDSKSVYSLSQASELLVHFYLRDAMLVDTLSFCGGMGESLSQRLKRGQFDPKRTQTTGNMMELDLETVISWLEQRMYEFTSASSPTSHLKLLYDSFGGLNPLDEVFRVSCKVVAINLLVFEYQGPSLSMNRPPSESTSWPDHGLSDDDWLLSLGIPLTLASVVVDDGCGLAHCWARGDAAVSLLGLFKSSVQSELPPHLLTRLGEKYGRPDMQFTRTQCLCCLVRRHGKIVLRSERPTGASVDTSYSLQWSGRELPDLDDQAFMQAVVAGACHNHPLVVTLGIIPPTVKNAPESSKSPLECCRKIVYRTGFQRTRSQDKEWPQLYATKVESTVLLSDVKATSNEIACLLENEL